MNDEMNDIQALKQRADREQTQIPAPSNYYANDSNLPPQANSRPRTLREQAEKNSRYHTEQADKHYRAAAFLRDNPPFDEFVQLVRSGSIQF